MRRAQNSPPPPSISLGLIRAFVVAVALVTSIVVAMIALYAVKAKLGINLMQGPSPLHDVFVAMRDIGLV